MIMIHTVKIDDKTRSGKKILTELHRIRKGVEFENPAVSGNVPEGYVSVDEFFDNVEKNN
jgi:hypothetical protein